MPIEKIDSIFASKLESLPFEVVGETSQYLGSVVIDGYRVIRCKVLPTGPSINGLFGRVRFGRVGRVRYRLNENDGENFQILAEFFKEAPLGGVPGPFLETTLFMPKSQSPEEIVTLLIDEGSDQSLSMSLSTEFNDLVVAFSGTGFDLYPRLPRDFSCNLRAVYRSGEASNSWLKIQIDANEYKAVNSNGPSLIPPDYDTNGNSWLPVNLKKNSSISVRKWDNLASRREVGLTIRPKFG